MTKELCIECDDPTGRAGKGEDSIYTENGDGPLCEECWEATEEYQELRLEEDIENEARRLEYLDWEGRNHG